MAGSFTELDLRVDKEAGYFVLLRELAYISGGLNYQVPAWFKTDLASIPRPFRNMFSRTGKSMKPAVCHDHMYDTQWQTRADCDKAFRDMLISEGMSNWKANIFYYGVRIGGRTRGSW